MAQELTSHEPVKKGISRKIWIGAGVVLVISLVYFITTLLLSSDRRIQQIYLVPDDAAFIVQLSNPIDNWQQFSQSAPCQTLKKAKAFEDISRQVEMLDSVIRVNKKLLSLVGERDLLISMHKTTARDWDALFILDMQKISKLNLLKDQIEIILRMTDFVITYRSHSGTDIIEMRDPKTRDILYAAFVDNHFVASYTSRLLEAAIDARKSPKIGLDGSFIEAEKSVAGKGLCRIFINYANLPEFMSLYLGKRNEYIDLFSSSMDYAGLWFNAGKDKIEMKGNMFKKDIADPYVTALLNSGKHQMKAHEITSARTAFYTHIGVKNVQTFLKELEHTLSTQNAALFASYAESKAKIEKLFDISLDEHFLSWMSGEFALSQLEPGLLGREPELVLAVGANDIGEARRQMEFLEKKVKSRVPVRIKTVDYKGFEVNYIEMKGFFRLFFGRIFDKFDKPYYTYIDDYVVFSNQASSLLSFIEDYQQKNLLNEKEDFKDIYASFSKNSTLFLYVNTPKSFSQLEGLLNAASGADLRSDKDILYSFPHWTMQVVGDYHSASIHWAMGYSPYFPEEYFALDPDETDDMMDKDDTQSEKDLMSELERFYVEKFQGNVLRDFFPEGTLKSETEIKEGQRHGRYREYYENGQLRARGKFVNNRPKGTWKFYLPNGKFDKKEKF